MMLRSRLLLWCVPLALLLPGALPARAASPVTWKSHLEPADARAGEAAAVVLDASIEKPWHIYSAKPHTGLGPVSTTVELLPGKALSASGPVVEPKPKELFDKGFNATFGVFEEHVTFRLPVKLASGLSGPQIATVKVRAQACSPEGKCLPPRSSEVEVAFKPAAGSARPDHLKPAAAAVDGGGGGASTTTAGAAGTDASVQIEQAKRSGFLTFIWLSICMGFLALLTPCVFPMVPITVSFFSKQREGAERPSLGGPVAYCLGIIGTFTGLGLIVSLVFGASGLQALATNPYVNIALGVLFTVLAFNLFGAFELFVPPALIEKAQTGAQAGRLLGPLAMGLTFTLTSFTCTVPFVGTLLATTTKGDILWPVVGMLAFSTAFASPFFLLALFPQWLARLPKSGGWLVTVKAFMGFVELAAALKFLSSAELQWKLGLLTRPVFLAVWFALALVAACYMLGLLRLPHDGAVRVGPLRGLIGVLTLACGVWILTGINGRPLGAVSAFLPPLIYPGQSGAQPGVSPSGVRWVDDYEAGVRQARAEGKLLFLNFTGINCGNCRVMEDNVLVHPDVTPKLKEFVAVELYTDKENDRRSKEYQELEQKLFGQVSTPLYAVITPDGQKLGVTAYGNEYITRPARFAEFLSASRSRAATMAANR